MRFTHWGTAHSDETKWVSKEADFPVEDDDLWEYSKEAFEKGFQEADKKS